MSEFGRGYATCLIQFTFHRTRLAEQIESYARMRTLHPDLFSDPSGTWMNGASDHLYELQRPNDIETRDWLLAEGVAARALDIGHGFRQTSKSTVEECRSLLDTASDILRTLGVASLDEALAWDAAHGLDPDKGQWSCAADLARESAPA